MKQLSFLACCMLLLFSACNSGTQYKPLFTGDSQQAIDDAVIIDYLLANNITDAEHTASGIYYTIEAEGNGENPTIENYVTCHYTGTLLDGKKFDSSYDREEPTTFPLTRVVKGWQEGIPLLSKGGKGTLYIPSGLAYGGQEVGQGLIPANSVLKFEVELIDIMTQAQYQAKLKAEAEKQVGIDNELIAAYVADKGLNVKYTDSGMAYIIDEPGSGDNPTMSSTVVCHYRGTLLDGTEFDSTYSTGEPTEFPLAGVVRGWQEGIPLLKPGGKGTFIIPSGMCYGQQARPGIPANSVLAFDVELIEVK